MKHNLCILFLWIYYLIITFGAVQSIGAIKIIEKEYLIFKIFNLFNIKYLTISKNEYSLYANILSVLHKMFMILQH